MFILIWPLLLSMKLKDSKNFKWETFALFKKTKYMAQLFMKSINIFYYGEKVFSVLFFVALYCLFTVNNMHTILYTLCRLIGILF